MAAQVRDLTPAGLRRLSTDERERIYDALLEVSYTWLSERELEHLTWGHGLRCRMDRADFDLAAAKVARERRIRLALALVLTCGVPPGAARRAHWAHVDLRAKQWRVPRVHLPHLERQGMGARERAKQFTLSPMAVEVFREASEVGDGWRILQRVVPTPSPNPLPIGDVRRPPRRPRPPRKGLVFPGPCAEPLPEHILGRRLRDLIHRLNRQA